MAHSDVSQRCPRGFTKPGSGHVLRSLDREALIAFGFWLPSLTASLNQPQSRGLCRSSGLTSSLLLLAGLLHYVDALWQYRVRIFLKEDTPSLLGDSTIGKSTLLRHYTEDISVEGISQTVGVDFSMHFVGAEPRRPGEAPALGHS